MAYRFVTLPPDCAVLRPNGMCYTQHDEIISVFLGIGIGTALLLILAAALYGLWLQGRQVPGRQD